MSVFPQPPSPVLRPAPPPGAGRHGPSRDSVTTIDNDGSRVVLYPADVRGFFHRWRQWSAAVLVFIYLSLPWIPLNGYPAVFLDLAGRRFHFFGLTLAAQDAWLLFFGVSGLGFSLFFVTALLGRVWCGWACPHTVFLDHVYRRIERWIEGDAVSRRRLHEAPMSAGKAAKRLSKHTLYALVSLAIAHLFLAYFVSIPELWQMMRAAPGEHWAAFVFVFVFAGGLYFNFAWFREQLCIVICPYGRLQAALVDDHSLVIGYDTGRGEPRAKIRHPAESTFTDHPGQPEQSSTKSRQPNAPFIQAGLPKEATTKAGLPTVASANAGLPAVASANAGLPAVASAKAGDCIDCSRCVQVCPTGIDIRQGLQIECIGCSACIDACDEVMTKVKRPTGLIRYDSLVGLGGGRTRWVRPRTLLYGLLLAIGASVATFAFTTVKPAGFSVVRMTGAAYYVDRNTVRNQFLVRLLNKRSDLAHLQVDVTGLPADVTVTGFTEPVDLVAMGEQVSPLVLSVDRKNYTGSFTFTVVVHDVADSFVLRREVLFLGPDPKLLQEEDHEKGITR